MSQVISFRLSDEQLRRLRPLCRRMDRSPGEVAARFLEEALRQSEVSGIDFRDTPLGRQAYVKGTTLAVWEVVWVHRAVGGDSGATAAYLGWDPSLIRVALNYAEAYGEEIDEAVKEQEASSLERLRRLLPNLEVFDAWTEEGAPSSVP